MIVQFKRAALTVVAIFAKRVVFLGLSHGLLLVVVLATLAQSSQGNLYWPGIQLTFVILIVEASFVLIKMLNSPSYIAHQKWKQIKYQRARLKKLEQAQKGTAP